ncbi:hypothetical protein [Streptosporangium sp. NPDC000396]|uniref:hypothetical protein n=1 Tax=Streptosporangium sp. NPDC000396 TaxID=3366185 RepID=UPI0036A54672
MGAWGVALFSDDTACDVRDTYRELIEDGVEDEEATRRVLNEFGDALVDPDEGPVIWLALAWTQSKIGRLDAMVRDKALTLIERGEGLELWQEQGAKALAGRQAVHQKVQAQLTAPQPERKRLRRPWRHVTDLTPGTVLSYRVSSGHFVLLRVARIDDDRVGCAPILSLMRYLGDALPSRQELDRLPDAVDGSCPLGVPVDVVMNMTVFCVAVHRKKDPDYRELGFEPLEGMLQPRPGDAELDLHTYTHWQGLANTMEWYAGCR